MSDNATFKVTVIGSHDNQIENEGTLEATPTSLVYTDTQGSKFTWALAHIQKYGSNGEKLFTIETGQECPTGSGVYIFSTRHAPYLESIVARHLSSKTQRQSTPETDVFSPTKNGLSTTPTNGRTMLRSTSLWSLPSNQFPVLSITEDPGVTQDGVLEVTQQEIVFTEARSGQQYHWPIAFLRQYGYDGSKFSFNASSRCPGGGGMFTFISPKSADIQELVRKHSKSFFGSQMNLSSPTPSLVERGREKRGSLRRARSAMDINRRLFEVVNISDEMKEVGKGTLEVTQSDLIYIDHLTEEKWRWPLRYLRRYGCDGSVFSFEAGRRCPGGEGLYAFSCSRAPEIHEAIVVSIRGPQKTAEHAQMFASNLSLADPTLQQRAGLNVRRGSEQAALARGRHNGIHLTPPPLSRKQIPLPRVPLPLPSPPLPAVDIPARGSVSSPSLDENDSSSVSSGVLTPPLSGTSSPPPKPPRSEHRKKHKMRKNKDQQSNSPSQKQVAEKLIASNKRLSSSGGEPHPPSPVRPPPKKEKPTPPPKPRPQSNHYPDSPNSDKKKPSAAEKKLKKEKSSKNSLIKMLSKRKSADVGPKDIPQNPTHLEDEAGNGVYDVIQENPVSSTQLPSMYANVSTPPPPHHSVYANITRQSSVGRGEVSVTHVPMPHRGDTPPPPSHTSPPDTPSFYQNVALKSPETESTTTYANVELKSKPFTPTQYADLEIIDGILPSEPAKVSHDINRKLHETSPDPQLPKPYTELNFIAMDAVEKNNKTRGTNEEFAEMLDRHNRKQDEVKGQSRGSKKRVN